MVIFAINIQPVLSDNLGTHPGFIWALKGLRFKKKKIWALGNEGLN